MRVKSIQFFLLLLLASLPLLGFFCLGGGGQDGHAVCTAIEMTASTGEHSDAGHIAHAVSHISEMKNVLLVLLIVGILLAGVVGLLIFFAKRTRTRSGVPRIFYNLAVSVTRAPPTLSPLSAVFLWSALHNKMDIPAHRMRVTAA